MANISFSNTSMKWCRESSIIVIMKTTIDTGTVPTNALGYWQLIRDIISVDKTIKHV